MIRLEPTPLPLLSLRSAWPLGAVYVVGVSAMLVSALRRRSTANWVLSANLLALAVGVWWSLEHDAAASYVALGLAIIAALALMDSMAWNIWWLHDRRLSRWIPRLTLVCMGASSALHLARAVEWTRSTASPSRAETLVQVCALVFGWFFYLISSMLLSRDTRPEGTDPVAHWRTDNSGTFNVGHDSVALVAFIWLGAFVPLAWEASAHSPAALEIIAFGLVVCFLTAPSAVIWFAVKNGKKHFHGRENWGALGTRLVLQWCFLILIFLFGWGRSMWNAVLSVFDWFRG